LESLAECICEVGVAVEESDEVFEPGLRTRIDATLRVAVEEFDEIRSSEISFGIEQIAKRDTVNLGQPLEYLFARLTLTALPMGDEYAADAEQRGHIVLRDAACLTRFNQARGKDLRLHGGHPLSVAARSSAQRECERRSHFAPPPAGGGPAGRSRL